MVSWQHGRHIIAGSNEVTLKSSYVWEYSKLGLNSEFGIIVICSASILLNDGGIDSSNAHAWRGP